MSMLSGKVSVPVGAVVPIASVGGANPDSISVATANDAVCTGRLNIASIGVVATVVYVHASPSGAPSASTVIAEGMPIIPGEPPVAIDDPGGSPLPDMTVYYAAVSGLVAGELRVLG